MNLSNEISAWLEEGEHIHIQRPNTTQAESFSHMNQMEKTRYLLQTSPDGVCHNEFMKNYIPRFGALIWKLRHEEGWIIEKTRCKDEEHNHQSAQYTYIYMGRNYEEDNESTAEQISLY